MKTLKIAGRTQLKAAHHLLYPFLSLTKGVGGMLREASAKKVAVEMRAPAMEVEGAIATVKAPMLASPAVEAAVRVGLVAEKKADDGKCLN
ncbi:MAG: hypothetical protein ABJU19_21225 [Roseobacter sp.]